MVKESSMTSGCSSKGDEKFVYVYGGLKLVLEQSECYPSDPGQGTPAMVYMNTSEGVVSGTYFCVMDTGSVDGYPLSDNLYRWLESHEGEVNDCLDEWYQLAEKAA